MLDRGVGPGSGSDAVSRSGAGIQEFAASSPSPHSVFVLQWLQTILKVFYRMKSWSLLDECPNQERRGGLRRGALARMKWHSTSAGPLLTLVGLGERDIGTDVVVSDCDLNLGKSAENAQAVSEDNDRRSTIRQAGATYRRPKLQL